MKRQSAPPKGIRVRDLFGMLHQPGMPALTQEELDEAIGRFHAEEIERIRKGLSPMDDDQDSETSE